MFNHKNIVYIIIFLFFIAIYVGVASSGLQEECNDAKARAASSLQELKAADARVADAQKYQQEVKDAIKKAGDELDAIQKKMEELQGGIKTQEGTVKSCQSALNSAKKKLALYKKGSDGYKQAKEELAVAQNNLESETKELSNKKNQLALLRFDENRAKIKLIGEYYREAPAANKLNQALQAQSTANARYGEAIGTVAAACACKNVYCENTKQYETQCIA